MVLQLAYEAESTLGNRTLEKLRLRATQEIAKRASERGRVTVTIDLRRVHRHILGRLRALGKWESEIPEKELRTYAAFGLRCVLGGRPEDPCAMMMGIEHFEPRGSDWCNCEHVTVRLLDTKETRAGANMDSEAQREPANKRYGIWSAAIRLKRPAPCKDFPFPDYFLLIGEYLKRRGRRPYARHYTGNHCDPEQGLVKCQRMFLGVGKTNTARAVEPKRATFSSQTLALLKECNALPGGAKDTVYKAEHVRHTTLSQVYHVRPDLFDEALRRSRHSRSTFLNQYQVQLSEHTATVLRALPETASIENYLLG